MVDLFFFWEVVLSALENKVWHEAARPDWSVALLLVLVSVNPIWLVHTVYG